jgi:hypothetical protein
MSGYPVEWREAGSLLLGGAVLAALLRGVLWLMTYLYIGPMLGVIDLALPPVDALVLEAILASVAGLAAVVVGIGVRTWPGRFRRAAHLLGWGFAIEGVVYLGPIMTLGPLNVSGVGWWTILVLVTGGNLYLLWIAIAVVQRTRTAEIPVGGVVSAGRQRSRADAMGRAARRLRPSWCYRFASNGP